MNNPGSTISSAMTARVSVYDVYEFFGGGGVLFGVKDDGQKIRVVIKNTAPYMPVAGEYCEATGQLVEFSDDKGCKVEQIEAETCIEIAPSPDATGEALKKYLTYHRHFRGINVGRAKISRLFKAYPFKKIIRILDEADAGALAKVRGFAADTAEGLLRAWQTAGEERHIVAHLASMGLSRSLANKILRLWPDNTIETLERDPYLLLELSDWYTVDQAARAMGVPVDDDRRLCALARAMSYRRLEDGHTLTQHNSLLQLMGLDQTLADRGIALALEAGYLIGSREEGYQSYNAYAVEEWVTAYLQEVIHGHMVQPRIFDRDYASLADVDAAINEFEALERQLPGKSGFSLNAEQKNAIRLAATENFSIITGSAGTGKTTIEKAIWHVEMSLGGIVHQMALSGRASHRMRIETLQEAHTIVGFLNKARSGDPSVGLECNPLIIIDEASMVDISLMYLLLKAVRQGARLVLIGDEAQLPPINYGLFFHKLVENYDPSKIARLVTVHRQKEITGIPAIANAIRNGAVPALEAYVNQQLGVSFRECTERDVIGWIEQVETNLGSLEDTQILCITRAMADAINDHFQRKNVQICYPDGSVQIKQRLCFGNRRQYVVGDPIIYTTNNYERMVFNGSLGRIVAIKKRGEEWYALCIFDGSEKYHAIPRDELLRNVELAYAITVHKSQGSGFKRVIIPVTYSPRLLDRAMIYTAITRSEEQAILLGSKRLFELAVRNPSKASQREVRFMSKSSVLHHARPRAPITAAHDPMPSAAGGGIVASSSIR